MACGEESTAGFDVTPSTPNKAKVEANFVGLIYQIQRLITRSVVLAGCLIWFCSFGWAQISLVNVTSCNEGAFPGTVCTIPATGAGHLIVVGWETASGGSTSTTITSITDNAGNSYAEAGAARAIDGVAGSLVDLWYAKNSKAGATSITITPSASVTKAGTVIWEFSGLDVNAPLDQAAVLNSQSSTATPVGAAVTTTSAAELVVSLAAVPNSLTSIFAGNAFTNDSPLMANGWAHLISSSTGRYFAEWNQSPSGTYAASTASFKIASAGGLNACDLNDDGTVNAADVTLAINMVIGPATCTANILGAGICNVAVVQRVVNASLPSGTCVTGTGQPTWSISGTISPTAAGSGATVTLSGASSATATANASGTYSFSGLANGAFTVAAANTGYTFTPASQPVTVNGANMSAINFTGASSASHSVTLSWVASVSPNISGYNAYRATSANGQYAKVNSSLVSGVGYTDSTVLAGQTYFYYVTAVNTGGSESIPSTPSVQAIIPSP